MSERAQHLRDQLNAAKVRRWAAGRQLDQLEALSSRSRAHLGAIDEPLARELERARDRHRSVVRKISELTERIAKVGA